MGFMSIFKKDKKYQTINVTTSLDIVDNSFPGLIKMFVLISEKFLSILCVFVFSFIILISPLLII